MMQGTTHVMHIRGASFAYYPHRNTWAEDIMEIINTILKQHHRVQSKNDASASYECYQHLKLDAARKQKLCKQFEQQTSKGHASLMTSTRMGLIVAVVNEWDLSATLIWKCRKFWQPLNWDCNHFCACGECNSVLEIRSLLPHFFAKLFADGFHYLRWASAPHVQ